MVKNKLVRDKIPAIIKQNGGTANTMRLDDDAAYFNALNEKLKEEMNEYFEDYSIDELADIVEVIHAIVRHKGLTVDDLERARLEKYNERGGFENRIYLVSDSK